MEKSLETTQFSFDKAAIGIYHIAPDVRIVNANEHVAQSLGCTIEEPANMLVFDIDPLANHDNWGKIWQTLCNRGLDHFETIHKRKQTEKELKGLRNYLANIIDSMADFNVPVLSAMAF